MKRDLSYQKISLTQEHEIRYWTSIFQVPEEQLKTAVTHVGNSADKVKAYLKK